MWSPPPPRTLREEQTQALRPNREGPGVTEELRTQGPR